MNQVEIERKYIIKMPDIDAISKQPGYSHSEIVQTYLAGGAGEVRRVRERSYPHGTVYTETVKVRIDKISSEEREREISESEYRELLLDIKPGTRAIKKTRHTFPYGEITVEIDVYAEWERSCIMEIELPGREYIPKIPSFIKILCEVTGEWKYSNAAMAAAFPSEII